ncbi:RNA-directed DNA polymerase [Priestia megaterium]|uniref:RNA-directed DNA polymerase n=1 Tax=Priestia megaterium TaxID=1404 RepID=UPI0015965876|nr:RNA-directed DNA polymerase [Priestia megaterium]
MATREGIAKKIVSAGYFAKQIPGEFISNILGEYTYNIDLSKSKLSKQGLNKWCKLIDFSIPKTDNFRRTISVPHPQHYILLARLIEEHWEMLESHFSKSPYSLTTPQVFNDTIKPKYEMSEKINRRIDNLVSKRYILQADITRYYPSIYTHSIPWALHSKEIAKANTKNNSYIGNVIDRLVRNMQDGQTVGIPIGPITSLIIQEIVGTAIDDELRKEYGNDLIGYRYTDDMEYYFSTSEEAGRALNILNKTLKKYELDLNVSKTKIVKIPQVLESEWLYYFKKFEFRQDKQFEYSHNINYIERAIALQKADIKGYFNAAFKFKIEIDEKGILNYAIKALRSIVVFRDNWDIFEALLLQSVLVDSSIIPTVFETIEGYRYRGYPLNYERITEFVNSLIKDNIELKNDFEVSWALSFSAKLDIHITEEISSILLKNDNPIINILVMILNSKKLLDGSLDFTYYESLLTEESLYDSSWLLYYECCIQGWLGKDKNSPQVKDDKFFGQLLDNDISFVNSTYSNVLEEVKGSMISLCLKYYKSNMKDVGAENIMLKVMEDYSFSLENNLIKEIKDQLEIKINQIETEEFEEVDGEAEEAEKIDGETEEAEGTDRQLISNNSWLSEFLTTNINETSRIGAFEFDNDY